MFSLSCLGGLTLLLSLTPAMARPSLERRRKRLNRRASSLRVEEARHGLGPDDDVTDGGVAKLLPQLLLKDCEFGESFGKPPAASLSCLDGRLRLMLLLSLTSVMA